MPELSEGKQELLDDDALKLAYIAKRRVKSRDINKSRYLTDEKYKSDQKEKSKITYNKYKNAVEQLKLIT